MKEPFEVAVIVPPLDLDTPRAEPDVSNEAPAAVAFQELVGSAKFEAVNVYVTFIPLSATYSANTTCRTTFTFSASICLSSSSKRISVPTKLESYSISLKSISSVPIVNDLILTILPAVTGTVGVNVNSTASPIFNSPSVNATSPIF